MAPRGNTALMPTKLPALALAAGGMRTSYFMLLSCCVALPRLTCLDAAQGRHACLTQLVELIAGGAPLFTHSVEIGLLASSAGRNTLAQRI
jgi:hypothetical protein